MEKKVRTIGTRWRSRGRRASGQWRQGHASLEIRKHVTSEKVNPFTVCVYVYVRVYVYVHEYASLGGVSLCVCMCSCVCVCVCICVSVNLCIYLHIRVCGLNVCIFVCSRTYVDAGVIAETRG